MKKTAMTVFLSFFLMAAGIMINDSSSLAADVGVTEENFPDASFRNYISQEIDKDKNGVLSEAEIQGTTKIVIEGDRRGKSYNVTNYQGIGYFTELEELRIVAVIPMDPNDEEGYDIPLYIFSLDVSDNLKLKRFACRAGEVNKLDLSVLPLLEEVDLDVDKCPVQDLSRHTNLKKIRVEGYEGDDVKITLPKQMPFLESLSLRGGVSDCVALPEIDFSVSVNLTELALMNLEITNRQLDLKNLSKLKKLHVGAYWKGCSMAEVNLEGCVGLETAVIDGVNKVNFQGCHNVRELWLNAQLPELSLTELVNLEKLSCYSLNGKSLDLRNNKKLMDINVTTCDFEEILFPDKAKFQQMHLRENLQLAKVDLRGIKVKVLDCKSNKLRSLKVRGNKVLKELYCQRNQLKILNVRKCKRLKILQTAGNKKLKKKDKERRGDFL